MVWPLSADPWEDRWFFLARRISDRRDRSDNTMPLRKFDDKTRTCGSGAHYRDPQTGHVLFNRILHASSLEDSILNCARDLYPHDGRVTSLPSISRASHY